MYIIVLRAFPGLSKIDYHIPAFPGLSTIMMLTTKNDYY